MGCWARDKERSSNISFNAPLSASEVRRTRRGASQTEEEGAAGTPGRVL